MKIQYEIAGGHKRGPNGLNDYIKANPGLPQNEAASQWVNGKFGAWIKDNITETEFAITDVTTNGFIVDFTFQSDADDFRKQLGGRELEA